LHQKKGTAAPDYFVPEGVEPRRDRARKRQPATAGKSYAESSKRTRGSPGDEKGRNSFYGKANGKNREESSGKENTVMERSSTGKGKETAGRKEKGESIYHSPCMENLGEIFEQSSGMGKKEVNIKMGQVENEEHAEVGAGPGNNVSQWIKGHGEEGEKIKSPNAYSGPLFSEVERTVRESCMGPCILKGQPMHKMLTWKKRGRDEMENNEEPCSSGIDGSGKKRASKGAAGDLYMKGRKQNSFECKKIGSGLAETAEQSRRPQ
jgi:hypothetical protein